LGFVDPIWTLTLAGRGLPRRAERAGAPARSRAAAQHCSGCELRRRALRVVPGLLQSTWGCLNDRHGPGGPRERAAPRAHKGAWCVRKARGLFGSVISAHGRMPGCLN